VQIRNLTLLTLIAAVVITLNDYQFKAGARPPAVAVLDESFAYVIPLNCLDLDPPIRVY